MFNKFLLAAFAATVAGCAVAPTYAPVLPHDAVLSPVSSLGVYQDTLPDRAVGLDVPIDYSAINTNSAMYANPGISPGAAAAGGVLAVLIIAAVDASVDAARNGRINEMLNDQGFDAEAVFNTALAAELAQRGLTFTGDDRERSPRVFFATDTGDLSGDDAVLDVNITHYGYQIASQGWLPSVHADIALRAAADGEVLMRDSLLVANQTWYGNSVLVPFDPRYRFASVDALVDDDPELAVSGLTFALTQTARSVADLISTQLQDD